MILKQTRQIVGEERKKLNAEVKQYHQMYSLFNEKGHLGQLFSRQERCGCVSCRKSIDAKCHKKTSHILFKNSHANAKDKGLSPRKKFI